MAKFYVVVGLDRHASCLLAFIGTKVAALPAAA